MKNKPPEFAIAMACEKMVCMLQTIENTFEFLSEYQIEPDENVKKAMVPIIEIMKKWCDGK